VYNVKNKVSRIIVNRHIFSLYNPLIHLSTPVKNFVDKQELQRGLTLKYCV